MKRSRREECIPDFQEIYLLKCLSKESGYLEIVQEFSIPQKTCKGLSADIQLQLKIFLRLYP